MKKLLITVAVVASSLLAAPKLVSTMVEAERESAIEALNQSSNNNINITTKEYNNGWFGADIVSEVKLIIEEDGVTELVFTVEENLSYGPIIKTEQHWLMGLGYSAISLNFSSLEFDENVAQVIKENLHIGALIGFDKQVTAFISTDKIEIKDTEGEFTAEPSLGQFSIRNHEYLNGDFTWGGFELKSTDGHVVVDDIVMSTTQEVLSGNYLEGTAILVGDAKMDVAEVNVFEGEAKVFSLEKGSVSSDVSVESDLLAFALHYDAKVISESGQYYQKPNLDFKIANLDVKALQALNTMMEKPSADPTNQAESEQLLKALSGIVDQVLAKKPHLKIEDLSVETEQGKISTVLNVNINEALFDSTNLNPMALIQALVADAKGKVPAEFLTKFGLTPMVDNFVEQGFLTRTDKDINFDATFVESQLTLNGKAFQM